MPSHDDRDSMPLYEPRRKTSPGFCRLGVFVVGVLVCFWLTMASPIPPWTRFCTKSLLTLGLPDVNGLVEEGQG
jgi:hypothetical protein